MAEVQKMRGSTAADEVREILVGEGVMEKNWRHHSHYKNFGFYYGSDEKRRKPTLGGYEQKSHIIGLKVLNIVCLMC